jgi:anti-sigma factor RsiW
MNEPADDLACIDAIELVTDYLEGALPDGERQRLEAHLATCDSCSEYLAQMRAVAGSLGGLRGDGLPRELRDSLIATLRDARER